MSVAAAPACFDGWRRKFGLREATAGIFEAGWKTLVALWHYRQHPAMAAQRLLICRGCPIYWRGHCGRPGEFIGRTSAQLGCWCTIELAAHWPAKKCWAQVKQLGFGWPPLISPLQELPSEETTPDSPSSEA